MLVESKIENQVAYLKLNNLKQHNMLTKAFMTEIIEKIREVSLNRDIKIIVLSGSEKVFSAGHHLKEIKSSNLEEVTDMFKTAEELMNCLREIPQLTLAKVEGVAVAAGCQLVAACDLALASSQARFGTPGINSGLFCSTPGVNLSRNIGRKKAMELLFTGELMSAEEALKHGLLNDVVPAEKLDKSVQELTQAITKQSLDIIEIGKNQFYHQIELPTREALNYSVNTISMNAKHPDAEEGISAFFEKRSPKWN